MSNSLKAWLTLHHCLGSNVRLCHQLLEKCQSPEAILEKPRCFLPPQYLTRLRKLDTHSIEQALEWSAQANQNIITFADPAYPDLLKNISTPPLLLYIKGNPALLKTPQIAMVGSRNPSHYGKELALEYSYALAELGFTITSGMALGIDTKSHLGALHKQTIAILGSGLNQVYPAANRTLSEKIANQGALVSEFNLETAPHRKNFPRRNRIISGLSLATLVIEASPRSGSLITAHTAIEQGRDVYAMPGSVHNPLSKGCHQLIQEGAKLVQNIDDIVSELNQLVNFDQTRVANESQEEYLEDLENEQAILLSSIDYEDTPVNIMLKRTGLSSQKVTSMLLMLELNGYIKVTANGYMRTNR